MNDRELLELAARAAGHGVHFDEPSGLAMLDSPYTGMLWNPLDNDGDALRLAVKLKIPMQFPDWTNQCATWGPRDSSAQIVEAAIDHNGDLAAATRRAITRAAAELARAQGEKQ